MTDTIQTPDGTLEVTTDPEDSTVYVTGLSVSRERKRNDGDYGHDQWFASERAAIRPALALDGNGSDIKHALDRLVHLLDCHVEGQTDG